MMKQYILQDKKPVECDDIEKWGRMMGSDTERRVAHDEIGKIRVSTVFLGLDHRFDSAGDPILFETLVFGGELDGEMNRYTTWEAAELGHKAMVERVKLNQ
mgnify:CR=1 FL=1